MAKHIENSKGGATKSAEFASIKDIPAKEFFTHCGHFNNPNNKLQKEALELFKQHTHLLIDNPREFIKTLRALVIKLNEENPRCKPLSLKTWDISAGTGISLGENYSAHLYIYPVIGTQFLNK